MKRTVVIVLLFLALSHTAYSQNIPEGEVENIVQENTDLILQYDENSNGDLSREEAQRADQDYEGGEISRNQAEQITRLFNHQGSYKDYLIEAVVKENTELIDQYDENSDGEISISELGVAGTDYAEEKEVGSEELNYLELLFNTDADYTEYIDDSESGDNNEPGAVCGSCEPPNDPDGDGLYEDVDGDGELTRNDVETFSGNRGSRDILVQFFDFDEDGSITIVDVDALDNEIEDSTSSGGEEIEVEPNSWVNVSVGDTLIFGPDNQNNFTVAEIRDLRGDVYVDINPSGPTPGTVDGLAAIGLNTGVKMQEFGTGEYRIEARNADIEQKSVSLKISREYSESSNFDCENYNLGENQYAFCSNGDEEVERGETQNIDLGFESVETDFNHNHVAQYGGEPKRASIFTFANGPTFTVRHDSGGTYRGADFEVLEWRGDLNEHDGAGMQAIIEVEPVQEPEASLNFGKTNYKPGEEVNLNYEAFEPGKYELRVSGAGQDRTESYGESTTEDALSFEASEEGEINAELIAPGSWWNPLDSDRTVAEASAEVKRPFSEVNHEFGEKFSISEDQSTQIEGKTFYLSTLVGSSKNGTSILWGSSEDSNTNSLKLLRINSMGIQYDDGFNAYVVVCSIDPNTDSAEIIVKENRFNPWEACDRHPDELRSDNDYEIKDYTLGEKVTLETGESLEFGDSRVYLDEMEEIGDRILPEGYKEWVKPASPRHWNQFGEGYTMTDYFYEGRISTATCETNSEEIEIVMERTSETSSNWPEAACGNAGENDEAFASISEGSLSTEGSQTTFSMTVESSEADGIFSAYWETPDGERVAFTSNAEITPGETKTFTESVSNGDIDVETPVEVNANFGGRISEQIGTLELQDENNQDTDEEGTEDQNISLEIHGSEPYSVSQEINVTATVTNEVAENGYSIEIRGPEEFSQEFDSNEVEHSFIPETSGSYSIKLMPGGEGLISGLIGQLTGSEGLAAETVEVVTDRPRWKSYCEEAGYPMDSIDGQISCIESDIVPECFEGEPGESCQVRGQSLCSNLLGLNYNLEEAKCE
jgi:hypothetical protein